jgi:hypothetical protein
MLRKLRSGNGSYQPAFDLLDFNAYLSAAFVVFTRGCDIQSSTVSGSCGSRNKPQPDATKHEQKIITTENTKRMRRFIERPAIEAEQKRAAPSKAPEKVAKCRKTVDPSPGHFRGRLSQAGHLAGCPFWRDDVALMIAMLP